MTIVNLYRYEEDDGSVIITPNKRSETDPIHCYRLIANEGKLLQKDDITTPCIDTIDKDGWVEIDDPDYPEEEDDING